jgi:hypothetical protein
MFDSAGGARRLQQIAREMVKVSKALCAEARRLLGAKGDDLVRLDRELAYEAPQGGCLGAPTSCDLDDASALGVSEQYAAQQGSLAYQPSTGRDIWSVLSHPEARTEELIWLRKGMPAAEVHQQLLRVRRCRGAHPVKYADPENEELVISREAAEHLDRVRSSVTF